MTVQPGASEVFICNATTEVDSNVTVEWTLVTFLPQASIEETEMTVSNLTEDTVQRLCQGLSGVYYFPLEAIIGRNPEVDIGGATFLIHHSALLVCNADATLTNKYLCIAMNVSSSVEVALLLYIPSITLTDVVKGIIGSTLIAIVLGFVILVCVAVARHRSRKDTAIKMIPRQHTTIRHHRLSTTNDLFEQKNPQHEFSRDKLCLHSILGEAVLLIYDRLLQYTSLY